jgi:dTDP-4-dehydrorhamnose reductase
MMKIIVAGSKGMFAQDLIPMLKKEHETLSFDQDEVDITDKERVLDLIGSTKPDLVINCAAYNQVDRAETDLNAAFGVNADGVQHLALACEEFGSVLCHFSTDYVFDGKSTHPYQPHDQPNKHPSLPASRPAQSDQSLWRIKVGGRGRCSVHPAPLLSDPHQFAVRKAWPEFRVYDFAAGPREGCS